MTKACTTLPGFIVLYGWENIPIVKSTSLAEGNLINGLHIVLAMDILPASTISNRKEKPSNEPGDCCFVYIGDNPCLNFLFLISNDNQCTTYQNLQVKFVGQFLQTKSCQKS